ncbi:hypothetical protein GCM10023165_30020 [Variovorax defluvii]|uniref:Uncharacterized protein n=1 Tax=Variovorax defluvii TaxID=913761 RepID=A0ABP8HVX8_9BURK
MDSRLDIERLALKTLDERPQASTSLFRRRFLEELQRLQDAGKLKFFGLLLLRDRRMQGHEPAAPCNAMQRLRCLRRAGWSRLFSGSGPSVATAAEASVAIADEFSTLCPEPLCTEPTRGAA